MKPELETERLYKKAFELLDRANEILDYINSELDKREQPVQKQAA